VAAALLGYLVWWGAVRLEAERPNDALRARAERVLVIGTDRAAVERFFREEGLEYQDLPFDPLGSTGHHALDGRRVAVIPALGVYTHLRITAVLDAADRVVALRVTAPMRGP
jgi:hypothetical protein